MVERVVAAYRTKDGQTFSSEVEAWECEVQLAREELQRFLREELPEGAPLARTEIGAFLARRARQVAGILVRIAAAKNMLALVRQAPAAPEVLLSYDPMRQPMRTIGRRDRDPDGAGG